MPIETDPADNPEDTTATDPQVEEEAGESSEKSEEGAETSENQGKEEETAEEVEIVVNGEEAKPEEEPPKDGKAWSKARAAERELKAENARLRRELEVRTQPAAAADPGPEPQLADPDIEWDEAKLKAKHARWIKATEAHEAEKVQASQKAEKQRVAWEEKKSVIVKSRDELIRKMPKSEKSLGYLDLEANVDAALASDRLGKMAAIMHVCGEKTPMVVAALGRDPARLKDLAEEDDMARFIAKVSKLEDKVQEKKKGTTPPPPEKKIGGTGGGSGAVDRTLERLRAIAEKTNNYTDVNRHIREQERKQR